MYSLLLHEDRNAACLWSGFTEAIRIVTRPTLSLYYDSPRPTLRRLRWMYLTATVLLPEQRQEQIEFEAKLFGGTPLHLPDPSGSMKLHEYLSHLGHPVLQFPIPFRRGMLAAAESPASGDRAALTRP